MPRTKKVKVFAGADPGRGGAICFLLPDNRLIFVDYPKKGNLHMMGKKIKLLLDKYEVILAIVEKASSRTGQGVRSMFSFGRNYGGWEMLVALLEIPTLERTPLQWMKGLVSKSDGPDPKSRVENICCRLFPSQIDLFYGPKGAYKDGRGDAALMAFKAKMIHTGGE